MTELIILGVSTLMVIGGVILLFVCLPSIIISAYDWLCKLIIGD